MGYVVSRMTWGDYATLADGQEVQVVEEGQDSVRVNTGHANSKWVEKSDLAVVGGRPAIEYGVASAVSDMSASLAVVAVLLYAPVPMLGSLRWWLLLDCVGVRLRLRQAVKLTYLGNFFNFASPAMTGGDFFKAYFVAGHTPRRAEAVTAVFVDRAVGLVAMVAVGIAVALGTFGEAEIRWVVWAGVGVMGGVGILCTLVLSRRLRRALRMKWILARLPFSRAIERVGRAAVSYRSHRRSLGVAFGLAVAAHLLSFAAIGAAGHAMGLRAVWGAYFIWLPVAFLMASFVPVPQGLGVLEWALLRFFAGQGLASVSQAGLLALAVRLIQFIWALPGLVVSLLGGYRPRRREGVETRPGQTAFQTMDA